MNRSKQYVKRKTAYILHEILKGLLEPEEAAKLSKDSIYMQFPKVSYLKDAETGEIRVGLSFRGVRKLVKKYPEITVQEVKAVFNLG